ncbi:MAG: methylmalonyl-CoA mutase [Rhodopseudomonas sp.]|nr:methylmalonyl-CoA mutase [Rhodopseudomonas sp.]
MNDHLALAAEFPATDATQWRQLVDAALKGADFDKRLVSKTYDGLRIEPLYPRAVGTTAIAAREPAAAWSVMQRADHPDPKAANAQALHDLENGATGLTLVMTGSVGAYGFGLDGSEAAFRQSLDGVWLDAVPIELDLSTQTKEAGLNLAAVVKSLGVAPAATQIRFGHDPLGLMARAGVMPRPWHETVTLLNSIVDRLASQGFSGPFAVADGRSVHAAGGSEAQELAFVLGNAVAYLRTFEQGGIALDAARKLIFFRLAADADQFVTIAKFRALRKLWARVEQACGLTPQPAFVSAETAWRMMTQRDADVNMLRTTIAVAAAGLGGADAIAVLPHTAALGLPDRLARRIARNTQIILLEESHLAKVSDPAAGSGGIEALTAQLCAAAWPLFQEIEAAGGAADAIAQGVIQKKVAATRAAHQAAVARRKEALIGTSDYPNLGERRGAVLDVAPSATMDTVATPAFEPLPRIRLAEPFETMRDKSDSMLAKSGARPKVFLATLGKLSDFTARAMFAKNFYEAGGIEAITSDGYKDQAAMIAAFKASGTKLACLCGSDTAYAEQAVDAAKALTEAGAVVHLAGRPGELETALKIVGVNTFIYVGCDVLSTLQGSYDNLVTP